MHRSGRPNYVRLLADASRLNWDSGFGIRCMGNLMWDVGDGWWEVDYGVSEATTRICDMTPNGDGIWKRLSVVANSLQPV